MEDERKIPTYIKIAAILLSLAAFIVGFWHAHLGLKNQYFFGSEHGSLLIAGIILLLLLICYFFTIDFFSKTKGKAALIFYLICAFVFITFNLNYFYPFDFKEDLVREDAASLKDTLQLFAARSESLTSIKSVAEKDYGNLVQLRDQIFSEIKNMGGAKSIARGKIADFNRITSKYGIKEVKPSLIGVTDFSKQAQLVDKELESALENFIEVNNTEGVTDARAKIELAAQLKELQSKYTPVLEFIQTDTTKINISNDKKNIENNPKNIAEMAKIVSEINSVTKPVNEIYRNKQTKEPFARLEATITKLGSVGHTMPSITFHLKHGTKEQKVGTWKNIFICFLIDLIVPLVVFILIHRRNEEDSIGDIAGGFKIPWYKRLLGSGTEY